MTVLGHGGPNGPLAEVTPERACYGGAFEVKRAARRGSFELELGVCGFGKNSRFWVCRS